MKKRISGILLALCLCLTLLPGTVGAAYESPTEIGKVCISVAAPSAESGLAIPTVDSSEPYFIDTDLFYSSSVDALFYWNRVVANGCTASAGNLYGDDENSLVNDSWYRLRVRLKLDYGYCFDKDVKADVPGAEKTEVERYRDDSVYVSAWFKVGDPVEDPTTVSEVIVSDLPTEREEDIETWKENIQNATISEGCRIFYVSLREWDGEYGEWNYSDSYGATEADKIYGAVLTVNTLQNRVFGDTVTATVNNDDAEVVNRSKDEVEIFVPFGEVIVDKAEVDSATWPIDGNTIRKDADNFYLNEYFSDGSYPYTLESAKFQIQVNENGNWMDLTDDDTTFSRYNNYRVIAVLKAKSYATFADSVTGDFNGTGGTKCEITDEGKTCTLTRTCAVYDPIYTYNVNDTSSHVNGVDIYRPDPKAGKERVLGEFAPKVGQVWLAGAEANVGWYEVPCVGSTTQIKRLKENDTFEGGKVYLSTLTLSNLDGYRFGEGFTVSFKQLDGNDSNYARMECTQDTAKSKRYNLWYTVGDVTQQSITQVEITGPEYRNGDIDVSDPDKFQTNDPVILKSLRYYNNYLSITLLPQSGYYFGRTVTVRYNGTEGQVSDGYISGFDTKYVGVRYAEEPAIPITVSDITVQDKVYDGTAAAILTGGTLTGVVAGDDVQLDFTDAKAEFADRDVGQHKTVEITGEIKLKGTDAYKYDLRQPDLSGLTADITVCKEFIDVSDKVRSIYVGESSFKEPEFTGVTVNGMPETVTGDVVYTLSGENKTKDEIGTALKALKVGEQLTIEYTFTADGNYSGTKTGAITITARARQSSGGSGGGGGGGTLTYSVTAPGQAEHGSVIIDRRRVERGDTVTITIKPDSGYMLEMLTVKNKNGSELKLTDKGNGEYTFAMPDSNVEVKATFMKVDSAPDFFYDISNDDYCFEAVKWAVGKNITTGVGDNLFAPERPCTRAQIVTFLWRAAGCPEPKNTAGFADVSADSYYAKAVAWAVESSVTNGTVDDKFSPDVICTRAQAVTFLARALNAKANGKAEFSDVPADSYFAEAVAWAAANGVTDGVGSGLFAPDRYCTRAQIVTFLWRAYNK